MAPKSLKRYSVYEAGTDRPICIYGTARECAAALSVDLNTFYIYLGRMRRGRPMKGIEIYEDDTDEEVNDL